MSNTFTAGLVGHDFLDGAWMWAVRVSKPRDNSTQFSSCGRKVRCTQSHVFNGVGVNVGAQCHVESLPAHDKLQRSKQSERIRASRREYECRSSMELWPGASSTPDFEFGYQKLEEDFQLGDTETSSGLSELIGSVMQPYMGDVEVLEEEEPLAEYVPPPPIPVEDVEIRSKVEEVMYTLLECIPGPMNSLLHDDKKWNSLVRMFSETVEVQDPLVCVKGLNSYQKLLKALCHAGIAVYLHDVYYENIATEKCKRWVYAIWTAQNHGFKLSGESRFEVNKEGKVTSVSSRWYKLAGEDDAQLAALKLWLADLYCRSGL